MRISGREQSKARGAARRLAVQALYQWQLGRQSAAELIAQFAASPEHARVDPEYFRRRFGKEAGPEPYPGY